MLAKRSSAPKAGASRPAFTPAMLRTSTLVKAGKRGKNDWPAGVSSKLSKIFSPNVA